jgi:hypothetical protein
MSKLPCGMPIQQCVSELQQGLQQSQQLGCGWEYREILLCAAKYPLICDPTQGEPTPSPICDPLLDQFEECKGGGEACGIGQGPGSCNVSCTSWSANCVEQNASIACTCTSGPYAGVSFVLPGSCDGPWTQGVEAQCAP